MHGHGIWLLVILAALQGCASNRGQTSADAEAAAAAEDNDNDVSFKLDVVSEDRSVARHLERHLDIQRFAGFDDLQPGELRRLLDETESNARDLLGALGYFVPELDLHDAEEQQGKDGRRRIVLEVEPGPRTRVQDHEIQFAEPMNSDAAAEDQRRLIRRNWLLRENDAFTQEEWDAAKTEGLRVLQRERYPTARIAASEARINADTSRADLAVQYDPGPPYRFGALRLEGLERYEERGVRNIARIPTGEIYHEDKLLDAQQRLIGSGYFDSAFLMLDNSERNPDEATVIAQLREAKMQKIVFGFGFSTDAGPRLSVDHTHNRMWPLRWRAVNQLAVGTEAQSLSTNFTSLPNTRGWAWNTGLKLERSEYGDVRANSLSLTAGRARTADRTERRYYLQYDASNAEGGEEAPRTSSALLGNYAWTGRYFNDRINPVSGFGVGIEAGPGLTITPDRDPFFRASARALKLWPFGGRNTGGKRSRLALRAELGALYASDGANIPVGLLFLTGGDTTVRGYRYQSIGARLEDGSLYGARYMGMASVEWQHPITLFGDARSFEHTLFADVGTATDSVRNAVWFPGVGAGVRWASPVGPLQIDAGYGTKTHKWRVHLRVGFQFR
jgi:translocation and assembly module TamA